MEHGFARIAACIPHVTIADCEKNLAEIKTLVDKAHAAHVDVLVFPELALTGATCGDLLYQSTLLGAAQRALESLIAHTAGLRPLVAVGLPVMVGAEGIHATAVISNGALLGTVTPHCQYLTFSCGDLTVGINGGDLNTMVQLYPAADPEQIGRAEARRKQISCRSAEYQSVIAYAGAGTGESSTDAVYSGHGLIAENGRILAETKRFQPDSQLVYCDVDIELLQKEWRMKAASAPPPLWPEAPYAPDGIPFTLPPIARPLSRTVDPMPFLPPGDIDDHCREIFALQTAALRQRLETSGCKTAVIGVSGGLDSTLALLVTANAFDAMGRDKTDILALTLPGFGTTDRTHANAVSLMALLGVTWREINIQSACMQHFADIGHDPTVRDVTYENAQARERTQILMDLANKTGGLVIGTGDLSEMALGWSTYGGDHLSMYAVNAGVPKTLVRAMVEWLAKSDRFGRGLSGTLRDIANAPISPELLPPDDAGRASQKTESLIGPFALHDFFLYYVVRYGFSPGKIACLAEIAFAGRYSRAAIRKWLKVFYERFFAGQFKRSCAPDGPQIGPVSLSPRAGWRMPSDAIGAEWLRELEQLKKSAPK